MLSKGSKLLMVTQGPMQSFKIVAFLLGFLGLVEGEEGCVDFNCYLSHH